MHFDKLGNSSSNHNFLIRTKFHYDFVSSKE